LVIGGLTFAANKLAPKNEAVNPTHKKAVIEHMTFVPGEEIVLKSGMALRRTPVLEESTDNLAFRVKENQELHIGGKDSGVYAITVETGDTWVGMLPNGAAIPKTASELVKEMVFADVSQGGTYIDVLNQGANPNTAFDEQKTLTVNNNGTLSTDSGAAMQLPIATAYNV